GLEHQCGFLVGCVLRDIKLSRDRHLHRIERKSVCFALGLVDRDAFAERRGRSILIEDKIKTARCRAFDRMRIARSYPKRRMRCLGRWRLDHDVLEMPETALVREALSRGPAAPHDLEGFLETCFGLVGSDLKSLELAVAISFADAEIEPTFRKKIERRRFLGEQDRIMPWRHDDGGAE